jgi:hypothetical protein
VWQRVVITVNLLAGQTKKKKVYIECQKILHPVRAFGFILTCRRLPRKLFAAG